MTCVFHSGLGGGFHSEIGYPGQSGIGQPIGGGIGIGGGINGGPGFNGGAQIGIGGGAVGGGGGGGVGVGVGGGGANGGGGGGGCNTVFETEWGTEYQEVEEEECEETPVCRTQYNSVCSPTTRQQCRTEQQTQCSITYNQVCEQVVDIINVKSAGCDVTAQGLDESTGCQYKWEGKGDNMRWALIPGTCTGGDVPSSDCNYTPTQVTR